MSGLLDRNQTSGNVWDIPLSGQIYFPSQAAPEIHESVEQLADFSALEKQMREHQLEFSSMLAALKSQFIFADPISVEAFVKKHRMLAPILLEAVPYLRECFGSDTPTVLETMSDEGPPRMIYALALWRNDRTEGRTALQKFDELWWLHNLKKTNGRITFDYELI